MSNNSSNGSENSEGYIREEPKENLEDVNYNGCASGDETIEGLFKFFLCSLGPLCFTK